MDPTPRFSIQDGSLRVLMAFDAGFEIRLSQIPALFPTRTRVPNRHKLTSRAWGRHTQPICFRYDPVEIYIQGQMRSFETQVTFFDIGAMAIELKTNLESDFAELPRLAEAIAASRDLVHAGRDLAQNIFVQAKDAIQKPDLFLDPAVFSLFHIKDWGSQVKVEKLIEAKGLDLAMTLRSSTDPMSQNEAHRSFSSFVSYSDYDGVYGSENVGIIIDNGETEEVLDVFELANVQMVELGFLDKTLERVLTDLYEEKNQKKSWITKILRSADREAERLNSVHIDATLVMERVEQGFKLAPDPYLFRIYELVVQKRYLNSHVKALDRKLGAIRDIFSDQRSRASNLRMEILEIIIIILIAVSIIPMIK